MSVEAEKHASQGTFALMEGILEDIQILVRNQFVLTRREVEADARQYARAACWAVLGMALLFLGSISLCLALAHLLHWISLPSGLEGAAALPLWASHGLVAVGLCGIGAAIAWDGYRTLKSITPLQTLSSDHDVPASSIPGSEEHDERSA